MVKMYIMSRSSCGRAVKVAEVLLFECCGVKGVGSVELPMSTSVYCEPGRLFGLSPGERDLSLWPANRTSFLILFLRLAWVRTGIILFALTFRGCLVMDILDALRGSIEVSSTVVIEQRVGYLQVRVGTGLYADRANPRRRVVSRALKK